MNIMEKHLLADIQDKAYPEFLGGYADDETLRFCSYSFGRLGQEFAKQLPRSFAGYL